MRLRLPATCLLIPLLCSCTGTSLKNTWKSPDFKGEPLTKIAALAVEDRGLVRQGFENRFVKQLKQGGATAITTFDLLSLTDISADKPAAAERFRSAGA